jgi:hypothetical protein
VFTDDFHSVLHVQHLPEEVLIKCDDADILFQKAKALFKGLIPKEKKTRDPSNFSSPDLDRHHPHVHSQPCSKLNRLLGYYLPGRYFQAGKSDQDFKRIGLCYPTHQNFPWIISDLPTTHKGDRLSERGTFSEVLGHEMLHALGADSKLAAPIHYILAP